MAQSEVCVINQGMESPANDIPGLSQLQFMGQLLFTHGPSTHRGTEDEQIIEELYYHRREPGLRPVSNGTNMHSGDSRQIHRPATEVSIPDAAMEREGGFLRVIDDRRSAQYRDHNECELTGIITPSVRLKAFGVALTELLYCSQSISQPTSQ